MTFDFYDLFQAKGTTKTKGRYVMRNDDLTQWNKVHEYYTVMLYIIDDHFYFSWITGKPPKAYLSSIQLNYLKVYDYFPLKF